MPDLNVTDLTSGAPLQSTDLIYVGRASGGPPNDFKVAIADVDVRYPRLFTAAIDPTIGDDSGDGVKIADMWRNTARGDVFDCISNTPGAAIWRHRRRRLALLLGDTDHTGDTNETKIASALIPAGVPRTKALVRITTTWRLTNGADDKTPRIRYGAADDLTGTVISANVLTTSDLMRHQVDLIFTAAAVQRAGVGAADPEGWGASVTFANLAVDSAAASYLVFSAQLENGADFCGVRSIEVDLTLPDIAPP